MTATKKHDEKNAEIRRLNDRLRLKGRGGYTQMCDRMSDFNYERFAEVRNVIRAFDDFKLRNESGPKRQEYRDNHIGRQFNFCQVLQTSRSHNLWVI